MVAQRVTHQALSEKAAGMSGLTMTVELNKAERDMPPKSDKRAPLMATTGCPEPSNFSAWRNKKKARKENTASKIVIEGEYQAAKSSCVFVSYKRRLCVQLGDTRICGLVCLFN